MPEQIAPTAVNVDPSLHNDEAKSPLEVLNSLVKSEVFVDQHDFLRRRFSINDPAGSEKPLFSVEFRGREELPITERHDDEVHVVLSRDVDPLHTNHDRYGTWAESISQSQHDGGVILGDPTEEGISQQSDKIWQIAAEKNTDDVVLHAVGAPVGVIDVALQLVSVGYGSRERAESLLRLRQEISEHRYSEESQNLMETMFDVCYEVTEGSEGGTSREAGLMLIALSLAGSKEATDAVIEAQNAFKQNKTALDLGEMAVIDTRTQEKKLPEHVAEAGEVVDPAVIEAVRKAGLIAVHTTEARPLVGNILRSTAQFNTGTNAQIARDSLHFSLNHAVSSHVMGNFRNREFTIVAPLAGLLEHNGAPAAMADVDTYFMTNPGDGLVLPEDRQIIQITQNAGAELGIEQQDGSWVVDTDRLRTSESLEQVAMELRALSGLSDDSLSRDPLLWLSFALDARDGINVPQLLQNAKHIRPGDAFFDAMLPEKQVAQLKFNADIDALGHALAEAGSMEALLKNSEFLESNDTFRTMLAETIRKLLVSAAIQKQGGKTVSGGEHYTFDDEFQKQTIALAERMGARVGLHAHMPEAKFEQTYSEALYKAQERVDVGEERPRVADFNWPKFDSSNTWYWLSRGASQSRRRAMEMGLMTFAARKPRSRIAPRVMLG